MLICQNAEGVHGQRMFGNPWSRCCRTNFIVGSDLCVDYRGTPWFIDCVTSSGIIQPWKDVHAYLLIRLKF